MLKSPVLIIQDKLLLRTGMRWRLLTSPENIHTITIIKGNFEISDNCFKGAIIKSSANVYIKFKQPVIINRLYRNPKRVTELAMSIDNADAFLAALSVA